MHESDEVIQRVARTLRGETVRVTADFDARAMQRVREESQIIVVPGLWRWMTRSRTIKLSPLGALAVAAGLAGVVTLAARRDDGGRNLSTVPAGEVVGAPSAQMMEFVFVNPSASSVSIVGDFNDWEEGGSPLQRVRKGEGCGRSRSPGARPIPLYFRGRRHEVGRRPVRAANARGRFRPAKLRDHGGRRDDMKRLGPAVMVLALVAGRVEAQDARLARLDRRVQKEVAALVDTARSLGIPSEPVVDKALEGAAKRAPNDRIINVVRSRFRELVAARGALGSGAMDAEVIAAADALHAGANPQVITALRTRRPGAPLTIPLAVLADLIARGVPADTASQAVLALATKPGTDAEFAEMRDDIERDIAKGAPPAIAAGLRTRGVPPGARVPIATDAATSDGLGNASTRSKP